MDPSRSRRAIKKNSKFDDYDEYSQDSVPEDDPEFTPEEEDFIEDEDEEITHQTQSFVPRVPQIGGNIRPIAPKTQPAILPGSRIIKIPQANGPPRCIMIPGPRSAPTNNPRPTLFWHDGKLISIPGSQPTTPSGRGRGNKTPRGGRGSRGRGRIGRPPKNPRMHDDEYTPRRRERTTARKMSPTRPSVEKEEIIDYRELPRPMPRLSTEIDLNEEPTDLTDGDPFDPEIYHNRNLMSENGAKNAKLAAEFNCSITLEEIARFNKFTGYKLFQLVRKRQYQEMTANNPRIEEEDPTLVNRRIQESWAALPLKERESWKAKAKKLERMSATAMRKNANSEDKRLKDKLRFEQQLARSRVLDFNLLDIAGHFKMLELTTMELANKLYQSKAAVLTESMESALLDTLLSSMIPLISLCQNIDELDECPSTESTLTGLNSLTFVVPGL